MCYCSARLSLAFPQHDVHYVSFTVSHLICEQSRERVQPTDVNCLARWTRLRFHNFLCFLRRRSRMTLRFIFGGYMCAELSNRWETIVSRWSREEKLKMTKTLFQLVCLRRFYSFFAGHSNDADCRDGDAFFSLSAARQATRFFHSFRIARVGLQRQKNPSEAADIMLHSYTC